MSKIFTDRQQSLMERALDIKVKMLEKYDRIYLSKEEGLTDESADTGIKLADAVERNIERTVKLQLQKEKIEVDRQNGQGLASAFASLHQLRMNELTPRTFEQGEEISNFQELDLDRIDGPLLDGELLQGEDEIDFERYTRENPRD